VRAEWTQRFAGWLQSGTIGFPHETIVGLDHAPLALQQAMRGDYFGTIIVKL
jgi:NADPH-dependent curcumin reductase CurA